MSDDSIVFIEGTSHFVRDIKALVGEVIAKVQVREEQYVSTGGYNAYQIVIETQKGVVYSIYGHEDLGPDIVVLTECPVTEIGDFDG